MPAAPPQVEIAHYPDAAAGLDRVIVVLSMGLPCWLMPAGSGFSLLVEEPDAEAALEQIQKYETEIRGWPPPDPQRSRPARPVPASARLAALLWALAEIAAFWREDRSGGTWLRAGELDPSAVWHRHEIWRAFTALFLHADAGHLLSNLAAGYFTFVAVLAEFGWKYSSPSWQRRPAAVSSAEAAGTPLPPPRTVPPPEFGLARGWGLLALSAVMANLAASAIHLGSGISSIGASTAVFAGLGLLCGRAARIGGWRRPGASAPPPLLAPLGAALALLALYGAGLPNEPVDLAAHLCGLAAGFAAGAAVRPPAARPK